MHASLARARPVHVAVALLMALGGSAAGARPAGGDRPTLFERLSGRWAGEGAAGVPGQSGERVSCQVDYSPGEPLRLHLVLKCTSGGTKVEIEGELSREGSEVAGNLVEKSAGITGSLSGTVGIDRMNAVVTGMGLSALFSMTMRGDVQAVTLKGLGGLAAGAAVVLRRA